MNFSDLFLTMAQISEIEQTSMFPFPFGLHMVFCCISLVFFLYRFIVQKSPYQLIMAVAIPFSLLIWISNSKTLFYTVGIVELVLLISAMITSVVYNKKKNKAPENSNQQREE